MIYTDVRLKIPSPVPFCTFFRWENRASLMSHPIGPKCACRHFFLAFFVLTLRTILFMSKMKGGGLWVFTWENAHQREFHAGVSYWFIIAFIRLQVFSSSHVHVTTLSWFESGALPTPVQQEADLIRKRKVVPRLLIPFARSRTGMKFYVRHSNRDELAPVWQFLVVSCKRIQSHERKPGWTHPGIM